MIVLLGSLAIWAVWTWILRHELRRLRALRGVSPLRDRYALVLVAVWFAVAGYALASGQYLDIGLIEWSRIAGIAARLSLLTLGSLLAWLAWLAWRD